jgi:hypothetical protein
MLKSIEENQYAGGFKRYEIDMYDEVDREPTKEEIKKANEFFDKIGGRYETGGSLIGNQKRIDLNKNGKIDAEDFKLLRTTMNGGWRKDHKYLNSSEDYEVIYARKFKPSRKGYKGKTNFANGGGVGRFSEYSNDALYDMMINLSRYENTESDIQMVKAELEKRKGENSGIQEEMDLFDDKRLRLRKPVMPERNYSKREWAEKFNPRAYEFMTERKMATGGRVENYRTLSFKTKSTAEKNQKEIINYYGNRVLNTTIKRGIDERGDNGYYVEFNLKKYKLADGGGVSKFKMLSDKVARNYEGKRVKPQYQKEYGKVYSKSEAKEVGDKVAGKVKANQKMATGGETKKSGKGGIMVLAKKIRKEGESWQDALKRAGQQLK